jgi:DNA-binding transcriptional regulator YhcF (GntR family)
MAGFIKLSRKFFSNDMWNEARTFSSCEAWLDLIQSARFEATPRKESIGGREVSYTRGQYPASIRFLAKRWLWSERKVRTFLSRLKKEGMIETNVMQGMSIITLCKYEEYNSGDTVSDTGDDTDIHHEINELKDLVTQLTTQQVTQPPEKRHTGDTNTKKEKIYKETTTNVVVKKDAAKAATLTRKKSFYQSLVPFVDKYPKAMIRAFFDYWSELNKSGTKMRFELEKTWELSKRLVTWANREKVPTNSKTDIGVVLKNNSVDKYSNDDEKWKR